MNYSFSSIDNPSFHVHVVSRGSIKKPPKPHEENLDGIEYESEFGLFCEIIFHLLVGDHFLLEDISPCLRRFDHLDDL